VETNVIMKAKECVDGIWTEGKNEKGRVIIWLDGMVVERMD